MDRERIKRIAREARSKQVPEYGVDKKSFCHPVSNAVADALSDHGIRARAAGGMGHRWVAVCGADVGAECETVIVDPTVQQFDEAYPDILILAEGDDEYGRYMQHTATTDWQS